VTPEQLLFSKTHEWVRVEPDSTGGKTATVGLSAFAVEMLSDVVFIDLPETGRTVAAGEAFAEIESVKAVSDIYSPVTGEIIEVNAGLPDNLDLLGQDAYGAAWIAKIRISDESGLAGLMDYATYQQQCSEEDG